MKVSYSRLSTFRECPFKYKCLYIDNLWHLRKEKPYLSMGSSVHLALKDFFPFKQKPMHPSKSWQAFKEKLDKKRL